jgi:hypothetical protein
VIKNFVLLAPIAEVKGIVTVIGEKLGVSGLELRGPACREDA